jgi:hypothetical protein
MFCLDVVVVCGCVSSTNVFLCVLPDLVLMFFKYVFYWLLGI